MRICGAAYRFFVGGILRNALLIFIPSERARSADEKRLESTALVADSLKSPLYWIHASSVGELESLWNPALLLAEKTGANGISARFVLTVFSPSARTRIEALATEMSARGAKILYSGYSPFEGRWQRVLARLKPCQLLTAKYEAWPELWASAVEHSVAITVVGARLRRSLQVAKKFCLVWMRKLPELQFLTSNQTDSDELKREFPTARVFLTGEPRWDRVQSRMLQGNAEAQLRVERFKDFPRPWGVFGSAWTEDFLKWGPTIRKFRGTLWIVPHRVELVYIAEVEKILAHLAITATRTLGGAADGACGVPVSEPACVLVNEMGFLSELYAHADWAYVGGGFGAGVHSTIEPAIMGIPLSCGPRSVEKFAEISELTRAGQLQILSKKADFLEFIETANASSSVAAEALASRKLQWKSQVLARMGASETVARAILGFQAEKDMLA